MCYQFPGFGQITASPGIAEAVVLHECTARFLKSVFHDYLKPWYEIHSFDTFKFSGQTSQAAVVVLIALRIAGGRRQLPRSRAAHTSVVWLAGEQASALQYLGEETSFFGGRRCEDHGAALQVSCGNSQGPPGSPQGLLVLKL